MTPDPDLFLWGYLTIGGSIANITQGAIAFFIMRFAHKVTEDPDYENKVFKKHKRK